MNSDANNRETFGPPRRTLISKIQDPGANQSVEYSPTKENSDDQGTFDALQRASGSSNQDLGAIPLVRRAPTWEDSSPVIDDFVGAYSKQREHWKACAERARDLIEAELDKERDEDHEEIFAKVTSRAKEKKSLEEKLKLRNYQRRERGQTGYASLKEISDDLVDLAGVRVVLYTPNPAQRKKVKEVILRIWGTGVNEKPHGDSRPTEHPKKGSKSYVPRHLGYQAEHYRTPMLQKQGVRGVYDWDKDDRVEIQVVSALGHAWAEAGHDVLYKTHAYGNPSTTEQRILDALNGLIVSGDLLLEQFRESVTKRTVRPWDHFHQFGEFLRESDILEHRDDDNDIVKQWEHFSPTGAQYLFRFLQKIEKNNGLAVRNVLRDLGYPAAPEPELKRELHSFYPRFQINDQLLTAFCVISRLLPERRTNENIDIPTKCNVMFDALILLQTFAGGPKEARAHLKHPKIKNKITADEEAGLNMLLTEPQCKRCLTGEHVPWMVKGLQSAWGWFEKQAANKKSMCGLFFRLAEMDIPAEDMNDTEKLQKLAIGALIDQDVFAQSIPECPLGHS
jgi:ppGpp synthetase/RelA/SpoT-type nucleotidyltranferase